MLTKKLKLADIKSSLSKNEMRSILGGVPVTYCGGRCVGSVGEWKYGSPTTVGQVANDINSYCRSGQGVAVPCYPMT
jgi:natural product precursor